MPVLNTRPVLVLADVQQMMSAAQQEARRQAWNVSIAVVDEGGHLLALTRLDGAAALSAYVAVEKARCSALGRRDSKGFEDMINGGRTAFLSAPMLSGMLEGGVPVLVDGHCIGAVGVSGVQAAQDAQIARAAVSALSAT